jgi:hypothetical protein
MSETKEEHLPYDRAIGDFLGIVKCLLIITDVNSFKKWMNEFHSTEAGHNHLRGYKLVFDTFFRMLISELERNISLGLTSDELFDRARFRGVSVNKLPNTCEKVILIKNLQSYFNDVMESNNWTGLEAAMYKFSDEALDLFSDIKQVCIINKNYPVYDIETAVNHSAIFQTYIFLNDTSRGIPHGYMSAMMDDVDDFEVALGYRHKIAQTLGYMFFGYKYGVQYLWYQLLKEKFKDSVISNIHETTDWNSFDKYFDKIQSKIINPLEKSTGGFMGYDFFVLVEESPKKYFQQLLEKRIPEMQLSAKENLQRTFLWYPIQLIDSSDYSFSGVPAFIQLLMGMIQIKRRAREKSKAKVIRITHGSDEEHRRSYSYAILVELSGYISDSSGWLLFYDCCDDAGSTLVLFHKVETLLRQYAERDFIEITNIRIEKQALLSFTKTPHILER